MYILHTNFRQFATGRCLSLGRLCDLLINIVILFVLIVLLLFLFFILTPATIPSLFSEKNTR
jgi:hypothetical protein